jgi:hypothetical protein
MLTCPECSFDSLKKIRKYKWECESCGTSFNFSKLRNVLDTLVGCQFSEDFIEELLGDGKPKVSPQFGERAWKWTGKHGIIYTFDIGNSWHLVIKGQKIFTTPSIS